jgi:hypothetical protein
MDTNPLSQLKLQLTGIYYQFLEFPRSRYEFTLIFDLKMEVKTLTSI